jgi:hypothetical protein
LDRLSELIEKQGGQGVGASTASSSKWVPIFSILAIWRALLIL